METKNDWKEFKPSYRGIRLKHKPFYYWLWIRVKHLFGVKTQLEYDELNEIKALYKIDGKKVYTKITINIKESSDMSINLPIPNKTYELKHKIE